MCKMSFPQRKFFPVSTCLLLFLISFVSCKNNDSALNDYKKIESNKDQFHEAGFVGSSTCISCHKKEYDLWKGSDHELAMKPADSLTVLGDFDNIKFTSKGITSRFYHTENGYFVNTIGEDGKKHDYKIRYTFGVFPLQQYIVELEEGDYHCLLTAWDSKSKKWFDFQPDLKLKHDEWMNWTGGSMRWNNMCAECHSTNLHKNFDPQKKTYHTTFSEINVSCEACHGPASRHVAYYKDSIKEGTAPHLYMDTSMKPEEVVDKCARCHSRRAEITKFFDYKGDFLDHYVPELPEYPVYEKDGQIKDEDYVYTSFLQSKMYNSGVSCVDCHDVHKAKTKKEGNDLCLSCHDAKYGTAEHHFHEVGTEAGLCVNCHMTGKTYMGNDFRRDHSFRIPRPDQSVVYGTPNACNKCHTDKSAKWAADIIKKRYGPDREDHFSNYLLAGQAGDILALKHLMEHTEYPDIARATALRFYGRQVASEDDVAFLKRFLKDSSALVRNEAVSTFENLQYKDVASYIEDLLSDPKRAVRVSSARYLTLLKIPPVDNSDFEKARKEYLDFLEVNADFPSGQNQIAVYNEAKGNVQQAVKAYRRALEIDDNYNAARMNLAFLMYMQGNTIEAEKLYKKVVETEPEFAQAYYMLGLLYNETNRKDDAMRFLGKACEMDSSGSRPCYNYAILLQENKEYQKSLEVINHALSTFPGDEQLLYLKVIGQVKSNQSAAAYKTALELTHLFPDNMRYKAIAKNLAPPEKSIIAQ